jgi:hypothetical protein
MSINHQFRIRRPLFDFDQFDSDADEQTTAAMADVLQRTPWPFQLEVRRHLARMSHKQHPQVSSSVLMVQPTSAGKSGVRDIHALILGGMVLSVGPLLSLGTDQNSKMPPFSKVSSGIIRSENLDDYKGSAKQQALSDELLSYDKKTEQTVMLFACPQTITNSDIFKNMIRHLLDMSLLRLVCCDEIHLFVRFGASGFRDEFVRLKTALFNQLRMPIYKGSTKPVRLTKIPVLFMTATCSIDQVEQLEILTGISVSHDLNNVFWPGPAAMYNPIINIEVKYTEQALSLFKKAVFPVLQTDRTTKYIWYTNNRFVVDNHVKNLTLALDMEPKIKADIVTLTGNFVKEQKRWHVLTFCSDTSPSRFLLNEYISIWI